MVISTKRFMILWELATGATNATPHCIFETNRMQGFSNGLNAAVEILNAKSDEEAGRIATALRSQMANVTGTIQGNWRIGSLVPDEHWVIHD